MIGIVIGVIICLFAVFLAYGYLSNYRLTVENYQVVQTTKKEQENPIRIVLLADLHGSSFGKANQRLLDIIKKQKPDIICIAGDMTVKNGKGLEQCVALCRQLTQLCPVYYAPGNHEIRMPQWENYGEIMKLAGVHWLDNCQETVEIRGKKFCLCGLNQPEEWYHKFWDRRNFTVKAMENLLGRAPGDRYTILLAHNPEYFATYQKWGADLICSGHVHGGIARIPFLGGVIDPSLRLFPKYDAGRYEKGSSIMILSRGLGTHHIRLRFLNLPELSVIDLSLKERKPS